MTTETVNRNVCYNVKPLCVDAVAIADAIATTGVVATVLAPTPISSIVSILIASSTAIDIVTLAVNIIHITSTATDINATEIAIAIAAAIAVAIAIAIATAIAAAIAIAISVALISVAVDVM